MSLSSPSRVTTALIGGVGALLAIAGFGAIFYVVLDVLGWTSAWGQRVAGLIAVAWCGVVIWAILRLQSPDGARARREQELAQAEQRVRTERAVGALATTPGWEHWAPLIRRWYVTDAETVQRWDARHRALLADPKRAHWAALALDGQFPTDAQIDYADDASLTATCEHLVAIERDLRASGIACTLEINATRAIVAEATLQPEALRIGYVLPGFVQWHVAGGNPYEPQNQYLVCTQCPSRIESRYGPAFPMQDGGAIP